MHLKKALALLPFILFCIFFNGNILACSMYKVTANGKTMVGCNEDNWRTTSRIWFENANTEATYGAAFTGSRKVGSNLFTPQSGMNEVGLAFSRLASYFPEKDNAVTGKIKITNEATYLTGILHQCATVEEVKKYIDQYDYSCFIDDVFIYIDSTGKYLIVEPYSLTLANDPNYVLSNFCPSITDEQKARKLGRYRKGKDFLKTHFVNASLSQCGELSDTMHVCRSRNGDGTLLTSIWDTKSILVNLYFYHNYDTTVQFNILEELAKGDHTLVVADLFPRNPEYDRLVEYITPFNTSFIRVLLVILAGILVLITLFFVIVLIKSERSGNVGKVLVSFFILNVLLTAYYGVLATNIGIYYFDAPYQHPSSILISLSSYIPFILLLTVLPLTYYILGLFKRESVSQWLMGLLVFNYSVYIISIVGFVYWGLFNFLNL